MGYVCCRKTEAIHTAICTVIIVLLVRIGFTLSWIHGTRHCVAIIFTGATLVVSILMATDSEKLKMKLSCLP